MRFYKNQKSFKFDSNENQAQALRGTLQRFPHKRYQTVIYRQHLKRPLCHFDPPTHQTTNQHLHRFARSQHLHAISLCISSMI